MRSEINVTPIIDVMLVLLIIFMVVTPLSQAGLDVHIPESAAQSEGARARELVLEIDANGELTLNEGKVDHDELSPLLRQLFETRTDKTLFLRAHGALRYAQVVEVIDIARGNGVHRLGIVPPNHAIGEQSRTRP